jgi:hypothetical protein
VAEHEIEHEMNSLKGKLFAGYDEIPEYIVKQCIKHKGATTSMNIFHF